MLTLSIDRDSFEEIRSGRKKEEYRELKPYYQVKLRKEFPFTRVLQIPCQDHVLRPVQFKIGVSPKAPKLTAECELTIDGGMETWGAKPGEWYYVLKICNVLKLDESESSTVNKEKGLQES